MEQETLFRLLEKSLKYTGIVYNQTSHITNQQEYANSFTLEYKYEDIPTDGLLFFVPKTSSNGDKIESYLNIRTPISNNSYKDNYLKIVKETSTNGYQSIGTGDIIANRLCIFRFRKDYIGNTVAVLVNSSLFNDVSLTNAQITNCEFLNVPTVKNYEGTAPIKIATSKDIVSLIARIEALENKILFGTDEPDEALANKPSGTIYIKVEED